MTYEIRLPERTDAQTRLIVLLHGRGSNRHDLFSLAPHFPANAIVVAPEAPFPAAPWGYGPGSAWYQFLGGSRPEPESFRISLQSLQQLLAGLRGKYAFGTIVLGGFSQGGTTGLGYALTHPEEIAGVLNFSGFLADHPDVNTVLDSEVQTEVRPRIFWGHGTQDPAIPFALAVQGRERLRTAGYDVTARDYDIGHWIGEPELQAALAWLESL